MKPVIGVMPLWDDEKDSIWMLPGYFDGIREAGGIPLMFPITDNEEELCQLCSLCSGFLLTGGHDVDPALYGEVTIPGMVVSCRERDQMEQKVLKIAMEEDKAILGICRGIQFLNAALGGTLYQDLPTQHPSSTEHHMTPPYDRVVHQVSILKDSPLFELLQEEQIGVNSYHHQAIRDLSDRLRAMAESEDGLIEAVHVPDRTFIWAVQWHPEFSHKADVRSRLIFRSFIDACR